jgi:two-component system, OmpR family, sensor histidine kinase SenX3
MVTAERRKSIALFIALGAGLILVTLLLYIGWVMLRWRTGLLLFLGVLLLACIIGGVVLNTIFLVREIRRNEQHNAFINAVTHELKTPVASIRLYLQTLQTRTVDEDRRQQFYRTMLDDSDRLLGTIEQILRTGRIGSSHRNLNLSRFDLREVVAECVERTRALHHLPPGGLAWEPDGPLPLVAAEEEVRAAIANLIDNAVKYSASQVRVAVTVVQEGNRVAVRVTDRGAGIPKSELKRIFKRFYRVPGPLTSGVQGTGLGLHIVRSVARRHGGRAWAESEGPGRGSTFVFELPVKQ